MDICEVGAIFGDVIRVFGRCSTVSTIQRIVNRSAGRHIHSRRDNSRITTVGIFWTAFVVFPNHVFGDSHPFIQFEFTVVTKWKVLVESIDQYTFIIIVSKWNTVGGILWTNIQGYVMALVESGAEDLVHPVGTCGTYPWVLGQIPTGRQCKPCVCVRQFSHLELLFRI